MRFLEITLTILLIARIFFHKKLPRWIKFLPIPLALLQVFIEGYRWQMLPLYFLTILYGGQSLRNLDPWKDNTPKWLSITGMLVTVPVILVAVALPVLIPVPRTYPTNGEYTVGTMTQHIVDTSRNDPYAPDPAENRSLIVQYWYPTEDYKNYSVAPWAINAENYSAAIAAWLDLPAFFLDHLVYAKSASYQNAPIADYEKLLPLVIFSHGFGGFKAQNSHQLQNLASQGYFVAAIEHPYASVISIFPDGKIAYHKEDIFLDDMTEKDYEAAAEEIVDQWTQDIDFLLNYLKISSENPGSLLFDKYDPSRVALIGHSTGGGAAVEFCGVDPRCLGGFGMDPWLLPVSKETIAAPPTQPFLYLYSEAWRTGQNAEIFQEILNKDSQGTISLSIDNTQHYDFTDLPSFGLLAPYLSLKGSIDGNRIQQILNELTVAFMDDLFKTGSVDLNPVVAAYPEIHEFKP